MLGSGYRGWQGVGVINCVGGCRGVLGIAGLFGLGVWSWLRRVTGARLCAPTGCGVGQKSPGQNPARGAGVVFCWGSGVVAEGDGRTAVRPYGVRGRAKIVPSKSGRGCGGGFCWGLVVVAGGVTGARQCAPSKSGQGCGGGFLLGFGRGCGGCGRTAVRPYGVRGRAKIARQNPARGAGVVGVLGMARGGCHQLPGVGVGAEIRGEFSRYWGLW